MFIKNNDVIIPLKICQNFSSRLKGMMFLRKKTKVGYLFKKCNSIHTFFMLQTIDVYMLDKHFNILYIYKKVKPWRIILPKKNVYYTLEFSSCKYELNGKIELIQKNEIKQ